MPDQCAWAGAFAFGFHLAVVNGPLPAIAAELGFARDAAKMGAVVSSTLAGAAVGSLAGGSLADRLGRRGAFLLCALPMLVGPLISAAAATGWMTPVSLLASISATKGRPSAESQRPRRSESQSRSAVPSARTGQISTSAPVIVAPSRTASCSWAETIRRRAPAATALRTAKASASVPPLRNTTVEAGAPISAATSSRARSSRARAARPAACTVDGLPGDAMTSAIAAAASGRTAVVAL